MTKRGRLTGFLYLAILASSCGCLRGTPSPPHQQQMRLASGEVSTEDLKEIIKEAIKENPELLLIAVKRCMARKNMEAQNIKGIEDSLKNRVIDTITDSNPAKGAPGAPVTIIEYTDYKCPTCSETAKIMGEIMRRYREKVRLVFKNNPLGSQRKALAARAALAAHKQGKFWEYHDLLFGSITGLHDGTLMKDANQLGLDIEKFNKDRNSKEIAKQIESEQAQAARHGLTEPPAFIINGVVMKGLSPAKCFTAVIHYLLVTDSP